MSQTHEAYYNEIDPIAAQTLRNLIAAGHIARGIVDERSIEDVHPSDLRGFTQCHFFAGFGVWSLALRRAGWTDDRPVWTGSCPCQPFSAAGQGAGFNDERHLWPAFYHLIGEHGPSDVFGEQVASSDADAWIDLVQTDMEALGHAFGAVPFPSAGIGAPHIRDRTYWVAHSQSNRHERARKLRKSARGNGSAHSRTIMRVGNTSGQGLGECECECGILGGSSATVKGETSIRTGIHSCGLADADGRQCDGFSIVGRAERHWQDTGRPQSIGQSESRSKNGKLGGGQRRREPSELVILDNGVWTGPTNGFWGDADWLFCRDGKWRPVEPGTFPLANGAPARVGRLRGYGNAINAKQAEIFIKVAMESFT